MSSAVRDLAEAEFLGDRDEQNNPLPSRPLPEDQREAASGMYITSLSITLFLPSEVVRENGAPNVTVSAYLFRLV